jgi:hypothetical protein
MQTQKLVNKMTHSTQTAILQDFHLAPIHISVCDKYYILYWEAKYLYTQLLKNSGRIIKEKISFTPIFKDGINEEYLGMNPDKVIRLSFRKLKYNPGGYVIIRSANGV